VIESPRASSRIGMFMTAMPTVRELLVVEQGPVVMLRVVWVRWVISSVHRALEALKCVGKSLRHSRGGSKDRSQGPLQKTLTSPEVCRNPSCGKLLIKYNRPSMAPFA